jgi:hypothetical protein
MAGVIKCQTSDYNIIAYVKSPEMNYPIFAVRIDAAN